MGDIVRVVSQEKAPAISGIRALLQESHPYPIRGVGVQDRDLGTLCSVAESLPSALNVWGAVLGLQLLGIIRATAGQRSQG